MKSLLCIVFLLSASVVSIAQKEPAKEYPVKVHVSSSELQGSFGQQQQILRVVIDGKKYQLIALGSKPWAFPVGDYRARIIKDKPIEGGQYDRCYELIFSDEKTAQYEVGGESE
jgi:hypothetical protein